MSIKIIWKYSNVFIITFLFAASMALVMPENVYTQDYYAGKTIRVVVSSSPAEVEQSLIIISITGLNQMDIIYFRILLRDWQVTTEEDRASSIIRRSILPLDLSCVVEVY